MKDSENRPPTLHFRGSPVTLDSLVRIAHEDLGSFPKISLDKLKPSSALLGVHASRVGEQATRLRMMLAPGTPPGTYEGAAEVGGKRYPVEVHVDPYFSLSVSPRQLMLEGHAGQTLHVDLTIANGGNVACEIGKAHAFGLYDVHGAERGIGAAFRQSEGTGQQRLERMVEELAGGYAGLTRVQVEEGDGSIAPGDVRPLRLRLHLPGGLKAEHSYTGTWPLHNLQYYVMVRATGE